MAKYMRVSEFINAEEYKEGLEDSWIMMPVDYVSGEVHYKEVPEMPGMVEVPYIRTLSGLEYLCLGDYIITSDVGCKYSLKKEVFQKLYIEVPVYE